MSFHAELSGADWTGELRVGSHLIDLGEITAVWFRSPSTFKFPDGMSDAERQHALVEAKLGLGGVLASLDVLWVNHPNRVADGAYKPVQLIQAARSGLTVAPTLITSQAEAVRAFASAPVITKMLGATTFTEEGRRKAAYTRRVAEQDLADLRGIDLTAHQFQRWIPKVFDARVVIIGDRLFGFAIHADSAEAHLDFRRDYAALRYERIDIPDEVSKGVKAFMATARLVYGAMDFVVGHDGSWTFLENNPGGQYGWLEAHTGAPLTATLADLLTQGELSG